MPCWLIVRAPHRGEGVAVAQLRLLFSFVLRDNTGALATYECAFVRWLKAAPRIAGLNLRMLRLQWEQKLYKREHVDCYDVIALESILERAYLQPDPRCALSRGSPREPAATRVLRRTVPGRAPQRATRCA